MRESKGREGDQKERGRRRRRRSRSKEACREGRGFRGGRQRERQRVIRCQQGLPYKSRMPRGFLPFFLSSPLFPLPRSSSFPFIFYLTLFYHLLYLLLFFPSPLFHYSEPKCLPRKLPLPRPRRPALLPILPTAVCLLIFHSHNMISL